MTKYIVKKDLVEDRRYGTIRCTKKHKTYEGKVIATMGKLVTDKIIISYYGVDFNRDMLIEVKNNK